MILLDTNVISETTKAVPDPHVLRFLTERESELHISIVTMAELHRGVALLQPGKRRDALLSWILDDLQHRFDGRIMPVGEAEAPIWGELMARSRRLGINLQIMDSLIAATALARGFALATRNTRDFDRLDLELLNPWTEI